MFSRDLPIFVDDSMLLAAVSSPVKFRSTSQIPMAASHFLVEHVLSHVLTRSYSQGPASEDRPKYYFYYNLISKKMLSTEYRFTIVPFVFQIVYF